MVSVVVVRPFSHLGRTVDHGEWVELDAVDAAVKSRAGLVSLLHGRTYQTRDMVAETPVQAVTVESLITPSPSVDSEISTSAGEVSDAPPKRRRGRPRKAL